MTLTTTGDRLDQASALPQGALVGERFVIERFVAQGGMGRVYVATQKPMGRRVALKVMRRDLSDDQAAVKRFFREAVAISKLQHPNTITLHDYGESADNSLYIAMEYLDGMTLKEFLSVQHPLSLERTVRIVAQITLSLAEAHRKGIVHRDLKPDNVFIIEFDGQPDFVKVIDFGIARLKEGDSDTRITQVGYVCGTPEYMSPEQARGDDIDGRSDLYALGIMMFEMLEGELPYKGETPLATVLMHQTEMVPSISNRYPPDLRVFVQRLMDKKREGRPDSAEDMLTKLKGILPREFTLSGLDVSRPSRSGTKKTLQSSRAVTQTPPDTRDLVDQVRLSTQQPATTFSRFKLSRPRIILAFAFVVAVAIAAGLYIVRSPDDSDDSATDGNQVAEAEQEGTVGEGSVTPIPPAQSDQNPPPPDLRHVEVQTVPAGAAVHINNRYEGRSPLSIPLRVGFTETLLVQMEGFDDFLHQVEVTAETDDLAPIVLTQAITELVITSSPPGANVIDLATELSLGVTDLRLELPQSDEVWDLELRLDQHQSVSRQVIPNRAVITIHADLAEVHQPSNRGDDNDDDDDDDDAPEVEPEGGLFGQPVD